MKAGRIIAWNSDRGFGWIRNTVEGGPDMFCHISALSRGFDPVVGRDISFEIEFDERRGKTKAVNVRPID
jgi:CspA family cold shock protein